MLNVFNSTFGIKHPQHPVGQIPSLPIGNVADCVLGRDPSDARFDPIFMRGPAFFGCECWPKITQIRKASQASGDCGLGTSMEYYR